MGVIDDCDKFTSRNKCTVDPMRRKTVIPANAGIHSLSVGNEKCN